MLSFRRQSPSEAMTVFLEPGAGQDAAEDPGAAISGSKAMPFVPRNDACVIGCAGGRRLGSTHARTHRTLRPRSPIATRSSLRSAFGRRCPIQFGGPSEVGLAGCTSLADPGANEFPAPACGGRLMAGPCHASGLRGVVTSLVLPARAKDSEGPRHHGIRAF